MRVILRDGNGKAVMIANKIKNEVFDANTIKLLEMFIGLQLCVHLGFSKLIHESSSMLMVRAL